MTYGLSTRAVSSPIAAGQRGRMSTPTRFLPLSQFFLQQTGSGGEDKDGKVLYGLQRGQKKKGAKDTGKEVKSREAPEEPKQDTKEPTADDKAPVERTPREEKRTEAITTTANVPTVPVPIGAGDGRKFLDRPGDKKKKKKKKMSQGVSTLLRRLF